MAEIIEANRRLTEEFGGPHNVLNPDSLEYTLEQLNAELFGSEIHPTHLDKAAFLLHRLARAHVFMDGNKRTAFWACITHLRINGYPLNMPDQTELEEYMTGIAIGEIDLADAHRWLVGLLRATI